MGMDMKNKNRFLLAALRQAGAEGSDTSSSIPVRYVNARAERGILNFRDKFK
jgi:hypothetical protein